MIELDRHRNLPMSTPDPGAGLDADTPLIERTLEGDLRAFEQLVARHQDIVYRVAARIVGPEHAEDVSQDTFLRAFHRLQKFRGESSFRTWLLQITHNAALDELARMNRRRLADEQPQDPIDEDASRQPATELEQRERQQRLQRKLGLMRPEYRGLLVLRDLEGLSYNEIADILDMPLGSVKGRLHRARDELIELLRRNAYDWELPT